MTATSNVFNGLTSWAMSSATNAGFSLAKSAGSSALKTVASTGMAIAKLIFEDERAPRVPSPRQSQPVSSNRDFRDTSAAYAMYPREAKVDLEFRIQNLREALGLTAVRAPEVSSSNRAND